MAPSQELATGIANAIATKIDAPRNSNPLADKVFHTDILVRGIDDVVPHEVPTSNVEPIVLSNEHVQDEIESNYISKTQEMQSWWEEAYAKHMKTPDGYAKVAVLLVKWEDEVDDMKTAKEAHELETLFREQFNYTTEIVEIGVRGRPQLQLDRDISNFIYQHDGPHNLLIIYYTGHGRYLDDEKYLEITGSEGNPLSGRGFRKDARANWNKVEDRLQDTEVESDILEILDTCYSSNLVKSAKAGSRKFELLSACFIDQVTASPGNYSFTRALIDALKEMLGEYGRRNPFSTFTLNEKIVKDARRLDTQSHLWSRIHRVQQSGQHILLTPLRPPLAEDSAYRLSPKGYLTLRFGLKDETLKQEQIELMTHMLSRVVRAVGIRRIDWVDIHRAPEISQFQRVALILSVVKRWKRVIEKRKEEGTAKPSPSQRRSDPDLGGPTESKRRYLGVAEPPSPPVSNSSLIDHDV
ncbi:hypothetical protein T440DRAFT_449317 [Plenodomus tracheiphilus IPT5]|uniref:Caspase family p20 domain-containing protein n=1 Tax=Plenodomus tracheiphilus IPT5 TaxID=1408161 RepID=A0A6A7B6T9_9PLEO|nr:hypothetical protein T440DRAFT_449317 [Plenodomus tracheiphilus IPT5]